MKLTIERGTPSEVEQLLRVLNAMNFENMQVVVNKKDKSNDLLKKITKPIKKKLDLEEIKKENNYKGVNRERFNALIKEINIVEPIELLLSQLSA